MRKDTNSSPQNSLVAENNIHPYQVLIKTLFYDALRIKNKMGTFAVTTQRRVTIEYATPSPL